MPQNFQFKQTDQVSKHRQRSNNSIKELGIEIVNNYLGMNKCKQINVKMEVYPIVICIICISKTKVIGKSEINSKRKMKAANSAVVLEYVKS